MAEYKYVDWPGLQYYHSKVTELIDSRLNDCIRFGGEIKFEDLPSPDTPDLNIIYRITNSFTVTPSNDWFDSSTWNNSYPAGTILQVVQTASGIFYAVFLQPTASSNSNVSVDLSNYYTIDEVNLAIADALLPYATIDYVSGQLSVISKIVEEHLVDYGDLVERVNTLDNIVLDTLQPSVTNLEKTVLVLSDDLSTKASVDYVNEKILEAKLEGTDVDLSTYVTHDELEANNFATESYVETEISQLDIEGIETRLTTVENNVTTHDSQITTVETQAEENAASIVALSGEIDVINENVLDLHTQVVNISQAVADLQDYGTF